MAARSMTTNYTMLTTIIIFVLVSTHLHYTNAACDMSAGCFPSFFNVLDNLANYPQRSFTVSSVCGQNEPEKYLSFLSSDFTPRDCDPTILAATNMVADDAAYWQSSVGNNAQFVETKFTDEFSLYEIIVTFAVPHLTDPGDSADARPPAWSMEKLADDGTTWVPLRHFAKDCAESFPGVTVLDPFAPNDYNVLFCNQYQDVGSGEISDSINTVTYYPGLLDIYSPFAYKNDPAVSKYFTTAGIRLNFKTVGRVVPQQSYVAIKSIFLELRCRCNGHAETCTGENQATCDCKHFTAGQACDSCLPLYNNQPWTNGNKTNAGPCQKCSCNGHATSCVYDDTKKYGVCRNCEDNTAGDFCDTCAAGFYINSTWASSNDVGKGGAYCLPCQCNEAGTLPGQENTCDIKTGQCSCKTNVQGRDCSECKDTFYGLATDNAQGCTACVCDSSGTIGDDSMCDKTDGACLCRANVEGQKCDTCKANTYGFNVNNPDGCIHCACDPGASQGQTCDLTSGQCTCRANINSRNCVTPNVGMFVPRLDVIVLEPEIGNTENIELRSGHGAAGSTSTGRGLISITSANKITVSFTAAFGGLMDVAVRYEKTTGNNLVFLQLTLTLTSTQSYSCGDTTINAGKTWSLSKSNINENKRGAILLGQACIGKEATYTLELSNTGPALLIDSVVFVPDKEVLKTAVTGLVNSVEVDTCHQNALSDVRANRDSCKGLEYSLMAAYLNGAQACSCVGGSTKGAVCDAFSGDCDCRANVLPPKCTECLVESYQFSVQTGCIACGCNVNGSTKTFCDTKGVCQCHPNVQGNKCDSCVPNYHGLHTGKGCTTCQCNPTYSQGPSCDDYGQCVCKPGVGGLNCDKCADGHYNLTAAGCTSCSCDPKGSTGVGCDQTSGVCQCRDNVEGTACGKCKTGFFGLGDWHPGGCISCFCWNKGSTCTSASGVYSNPISTMSTSLPDGWTAANSTGSPLLVAVEGTGGDKKLKISPLEEAGDDFYFIGPAKYKGDWSSAYGRSLTVVISSAALPSATDASPATTTTDIILEGAFASKSLKYSATLQSNGAKQMIKILMRETVWQAEKEGQPSATATYAEMMQVLTSVSAFKIQAYNSKTIGHASMLDSVTLEAGSAGPNTDVAVNNMEMCQCQEGYGGNHCEVCAPGFTRSIPNNQDPTGQCAACSCNGHAKQACTDGVCSGDVPCNPVSGVCECIHNTEGDNCQTCKTGYYGDPTKAKMPDDCLPCACPGIVVNNEVNVFATSCSQNSKGAPVCNECATGHSGDHCEICVDGYYGTPEDATNAGGKCQPCICNGRADTCDPRTGVCTDCRNNTSGQQCDICAPGYYGNAMTFSCQECVCKNYVGSTGNCDPTTGKCECLPNVEGDVCDQCTDTAFNLQPKIGCEPCSCHEDGATQPGCDKTTGQCTCRNLVEGRQCDQCQDSFWNINQATGCSPCDCNALGTKKEGSSIIPTCDLETGQCQCALPGTIGRTCDACSPVTTLKLTYVKLFFLGEFPNCQLCGECFDSWGVTIDELGKETETLNNQTKDIWETFGNQMPEQIATSLSVTEEKIKKAAESVVAFKDIAQSLLQLQERVSQATTKNGVLNSRNDLLSDTEKALKDQLVLLEALTEMIKLTESSTTSVKLLEQKMNSLMANRETAFTLGVSSWNSIQTLAFVVADPADRERQLRQQADASVQLAKLANTTYQLAEILYTNNLKPGSEDSEGELKHIADELAKTSTQLATVQTTATEVTTSITSIRNSLKTLVGASEKARADTLEMVDNLQESVEDASTAKANFEDAQELADKLLAEAKQAETTMRNSISSILENVAALDKAQTDMTSAQLQSTGVLGISLKPLEDLTILMADIKSVPLSSADVQAVEIKAQKALILAESSLSDTQKALGLAHEVNQVVVIMEEDIAAAKNLKTEAQGLKNAADMVDTEIGKTIQKVGEHINKTKEDIASVTSQAEELLVNVTIINTCLDQAKVKVTDSTTSAGRAEDRAQTTSDNQQVLLKLMVDINTASNDQTVTQALNSLTQGSTVVGQLATRRTEVESITDIEALVQDLVAQVQEINTLDSEINALNSELDTMLLSLQENLDGGSCNVNV